jgi:hypothetical protein
MDDRVLLIGTDTIQTVRQYNEETFEYQVQQDDDAASAVWVLGRYLELVKPAEGMRLPATDLPLSKANKAAPAWSALLERITSPHERSFCCLSF